jgi:site-specific recombinase XerD
MQDVYERFLERYQAERNPARNTILAIQKMIPRFLSFCRERGREDLNQITREDVIGYLNSLNGSRTSTKKSCKAFITLFLNACFSYGFRADQMGTIHFKGPADVPRAPLKGFTAEEMATMGRNLQRLDLRERIIFNLLSNRPLRISELVNLTVGDVNLEAKEFPIFRSKNTKTRIVSLPRETWEDLKELIGEDRPKDQSIFGLGTRAMGDTVRQIIRKLGVNPNGRSAHAFRHTVIMGMLRGEAKVELAVVAQSAGNTPKTIYSNYAGQVSIDDQRAGEKAFDRVKRENNHMKKRGLNK